MRQTVMSGLVAMAAAALLLGCGAAPARAEAAATATTTTAADNVVATYAEQSGARFAGDCAAAVPGRDSGKVCSRLVEQRDGVAAYLVGRTFSEFDRWVFVSTGETARLAGVTPLDLATDDGTIPWPAPR